MSVYFIQSGLSGCIKIGNSHDPEKRLAQMQTGNPETLTLLAVMPGDSKTETELHHEFRYHQVSGEWFAPHVDLWAIIERHWCYDEANGIRAHAVVGNYITTTIDGALP